MFAAPEVAASVAAAAAVAAVVAVLELNESASEGAGGTETAEITVEDVALAAKARPMAFCLSVVSIGMEEAADVACACGSNTLAAHTATPSVGAAGGSNAPVVKGAVVATNIEPSCT